MADKERGGFVAWSRELLRAEKLDELAEAPRDTGRDSFFVWLMRPEQLPMDPVEGQRVDKSFLARLFDREELPEDPVSPPGRRP